MLVHILLAINPKARRERVAELLPSRDVVVSVVERPAAHWSSLSNQAFDLVLASPDTVPEPYAESIAALRDLPEHPEVAIVSGSDDPLERARFQAAGTFGVVYLQLADEELRSTLARLIERRREGALQRLRAEGAQRHELLFEVASTSPAMQQVQRIALRVATSDSSVLILGETGVGKVWLARAIHAAGSREPEPFIALNCAAVPESLLESELFGHERGAFTGAHRARRGYFELAHRGTLFLDEIAEMPVALQTKLLRVLQDHRIQRVGGEREITVDVRVMAATNRDLATALQTGQLRRDLYYRLAVVTIEIPPLRARRQDIAALFRNQVEIFRAKLGRFELDGVSAEALEALQSYSWPGNVRELINVAERAVLLGRGDQIAIDDLPAELATQRSAPPLDAPRLRPELLELSLPEACRLVAADVERVYLAHQLQLMHGHLGKVAERAGIDVRTLYNKMRALGLEKADFRSPSSSSVSVAAPVAEPQDTAVRERRPPRRTTTGP